LKKYGKGIRILAILIMLLILVGLNACISGGEKSNVVTGEELYVKVEYDNIIDKANTGIVLNTNGEKVSIKLNGKEVEVVPDGNVYNLDLQEGENEIIVIVEKEVNGTINKTEELLSILYLKDGLNYNDLFEGVDIENSGKFIFPEDGAILNETFLAGEVELMDELEISRNIDVPTPGVIQKGMYLDNLHAIITASAMNVGDEVELYIFANNKVVDYINNGVSVVTEAGIRRIQYKSVGTDNDGEITISNVKYVLEQGLNELKIIAKQKNGLTTYQVVSTITIDTYSPYLELDYPKSNGNWIIPEGDEIVGDYFYTRLNLQMSDVTNTKLFALVTTDSSITNINSLGNELLYADDQNVSGTAVSIDTSTRVKVKYDSTKMPAVGEIGYLYIAAVDNSDDNTDYTDATGHINLKRLKFKRTESVEIGIIRIDGKEYKEGNILEITSGEFDIFVANNDEGAAATLETRLPDGALLSQMSVAPTIGGFEEKSINVRNKLGLTSLSHLDTFSMILRIKIDELGLEENQVIRLQYIDKGQSIDLETDKIEFSFDSDKGTRLGVIDDKIYFDKTSFGAPIIETMTIENPSQLNYLLKVDSYFYHVTGGALGTFDFTENTTEDTSGTPIELTGDAPKKEVSLYLGDEKIKTYELIYLVPEDIDLEFDKLTLKPVESEVKVKGKLNMPISILEEYDLKVQLDSVRYLVSDNDIRFPNSSTVEFESNFTYNGEMEVKIVLENKYKPITTSARKLHNRRIKIMGIEDTSESLMVVDNEQFIKIENMTDFNNSSSSAVYMYLDGKQVNYDFENGDTINLEGISEVQIVLNRDDTPDDTVDDPNTYIERNLFVIEPSDTDIPAWLVVPQNNKGYTAAEENGGGAFVVSGRVQNADEVKLGLRILNSEINKYEDQIWEANVPQRTTDGFYIDIFLDEDTGDFVSPDLTEAVYLRTTTGAPIAMIEDGLDYEVVLIAENSSKGISSRKTYTCYYDQSPPLVNAAGNWEVLYIDSKGKLRQDDTTNDEIPNAGIVGSLVKNDSSGEYSITTVNDSEIRFDIDETKPESVILIKNQKGYNDYLVGYVKAPVDEHITIELTEKDGENIRGIFVTKNTGKKLFESLGDNLYEKLTVHFEDRHKIKTINSGEVLYNNKYVDFDENKVSAEIVEAEQEEFPLTKLYVDSMPDLKTTSLILKITKDGEVIKEEEVSDLNINSKTFYLSGDIGTGDEVYLEAIDKYSNDVFRKSGKTNTLVKIEDKLAPRLPTPAALTIVDKPIGMQDVISGTVATYERGATVKVIINDVEKARGIVNENGEFSIDCDTSIKESDKQILLAMEDTNGNKTEDSRFAERRYLNITDKFVFDYNGKVKDIASSKDGTGSLYAEGEAITITWDISDDARADTDDDGEYENKVKEYRITFERADTGEVLHQAVTSEKTYTIANANDLLGIVDKKEITVRVIPISDLGFEGSILNNDIKNIFVDTKDPDIDMIDVSKIKISVSNNQITFESGVINNTLNTEDYLDIKIYGSGIEQYVRYKDDTITDPSTNIENTVVNLPVDITNEDTFNITLIDGAGNTSDSPETIMSYDDEAPSISGLQVDISSINSFEGGIEVVVSYTGEDNITVVAYRGVDTKVYGSEPMFEQGTKYRLFIEGTETDEVYLKVVDAERGDNGVYGGKNYSTGSKDLNNNIIN